MSNLIMLRRLMKESGMKTTAIASKAKMQRTTLYNRLKGIGEFTASEIVGLTKAINLSLEEREEIFFKIKDE